MENYNINIQVGEYRDYRYESYQMNIKWQLVFFSIACFSFQLLACHSIIEASNIIFFNTFVVTFIKENNCVKCDN